MSFYCTAPVLDCNDPQTLEINFNMTASGIAGCHLEMRRRRAGRIYLAAALFNAVCVIITTALFIYCATGPTQPPDSIDMNKPTTKDIQKALKRYSIKKRSILATTLGAIGHLIFSTSILFTQAFNNDIGCQLMLWSVIIGFYTWMVALIIRAYRLGFLFRLNQLKVKYLRMTSEERSVCIKEKDYRWYLINSKEKDYKLRRPYIVYIITLLIIIITAVPTEIMTMRYSGRCLVRWGSGALVGLCGVFLILAPFLLYRLKNNVDAHGIRTEIFVDVVIAIPFFALYFTWFFLSAQEGVNLSFYVNKTFGPGNWVVFFTITSHFISVVVPVIQYYLPSDNDILSRSVAKLKAFCNRRKPIGELETGTAANSEATPTFIPELSIESLERSLADPDLMLKLQDLAIRDFSSENVLFYDRYLKLEERFKNEIITSKIDNANSIGPSKNWITTIAKKSPNIPTRSTVEGEQQQVEKDDWSQERFLSLPIPYKLYRDFIRFYDVYIQNGAPNQVNISYRARASIDEVFAYIYNKYPELRLDRSNDRLSTAGSAYFREQETSEKEVSNEGVEHHELPPVLNFGVFENARKEICWNIFNSVYPKLVNMYKQP